MQELDWSDLRYALAVGASGSLAAAARQMGVNHTTVLRRLDALEARSDRRIGLLTGNIEVGARAKLRAAGIDPDRFTVCAFGSDHEVRGELPAIAQRRAQERLGLTVYGDAMVIIGDTPADIDCTRAIGARAITVATGRYSVEELAAHRPVAVFKDLSDTGAVMRAIDDA